MKNIILIGFMGSGKTSVGKVLSQLLKRGFIDMDEEIEKREGRKIKEIFEQNGEEYFRNLETNLLKELSKENDKVISTGGGIIVKKENIELLKNTGTVVFLHTEQEQLIKNLRNSQNRPLIDVENFEDKVAELLEQREAIYLNTADMIIQTSNKSIENIAEEIKSLL